jgi:hypothetical protein
MFSLLQASFWYLDLAIAAGVTAWVVLACRGTARGKWIQGMFWLGAVIGLTWEVPLFVSTTVADEPVLLMLRPPPIHPLGMIVAHSLWDGGLFLAGLALVGLACPRPILRRFSWRELGVLVLWGQGSELLVELGGVKNEAWSYAGDKAWNPVLLEVSGHPITLMPQLIWLAAPIVFYLVALRLTARTPAPAAPR